MAKPKKRRDIDALDGASVHELKLEILEHARLLTDDREKLAELFELLERFHRAAGGGRLSSGPWDNDDPHGRPMSL